MRRLWARLDEQDVLRLVRSTLVFVVAAVPVSVAAQPTISVPVPRLSGHQLPAGREGRDALMAQVLLDRNRNSPGVVDGVAGGNTKRAIEAFQLANSLTADGRVSAALLERLGSGDSGPLLQRYTIADVDVAGPFVDVPDDMESQAELETLAYGSPAEGIAEKFHMAQTFLAALNPGVDFSRAGTEIAVIVPGKDEAGAHVARIEVDKAASTLRAYGDNGQLLATYPATIGSRTFPSPEGAMEVTAVAGAPTYHFDPEGREWGPDKKLTIAAGPNNPVGGTWIDLSKEGYGIHGTPDPELVGKTASHGCVRLTNWDAAELAKAVSKGTKVAFV